jgi:hypothetical protein
MNIAEPWRIPVKDRWFCSAARKVFGPCRVARPVSDVKVVLESLYHFQKGAVIISVRHDIDLWAD